MCPGFERTQYIPVLVATLGRGREEDRRPGPPPWTDLEGSGEADAPRAHPGQVAVHAETAAHPTGVGSVRGHRTALQPLGQLAGEQQVRQLRAAVGLETLIASLALEVVEAHAPPGGVMADRGQADDPRRRAGAQPVQEEVGQVEVAQVVDAERLLEPLRGEQAVRPRPAGVVHQHIKPVPTCEDLVGGAADGAQVGQIQRHDVDVVVPGPPGHLGRRRGRLRLVAAGQHGRGLERGHTDRRLQPDAHVGPGDDDDLASQHDGPQFEHTERARAPTERARAPTERGRVPTDPADSLLVSPPMTAEHVRHAAADDLVPAS